MSDDKIPTIVRHMTKEGQIAHDLNHNIARMLKYIGKLEKAYIDFKDLTPINIDSIDKFPDNVQELRNEIKKNIQLTDSFYQLIKDEKENAKMLLSSTILACFSPRD